MVEFSKNSSKNKELKTTVEEFMKFMIEERNQKNDYLNTRINDIEHKVLLLTNTITKNPLP